MTNIVATQSAEIRVKVEAMLKQADRLLCESLNERMWSDGEPIDDHRLGGQWWLSLAGDPMLPLQVPSDVDLASH